MTRGTPDEIATPVIAFVEREPVEAEELLHHQRELVGGAVGVGRDAPVVDELVRRGTSPTTVWVFPASIGEQHAYRSLTLT